jgi:hypothetical protein
MRRRDESLFRARARRLRMGLSGMRDLAWVQHVKALTV